MAQSFFGSNAARANVLTEKAQDALPGVARRRLGVGGTLIVEERVPRVWIDLDVVRNVIAVQRGVQLLARQGGEVLAGIRTDDGTDARDGFEWTRIPSVVRGDGLEPVILTGPGDGETAAHTVPDRAEMGGVYPWLLG